MSCDPDYRIEYFSAGERIPQVSLPISIAWNRKLDDISQARLIHPVQGDDCCQILSSLEPYMYEVAIIRNGAPVWYGWLSDVEYGRNFVTVDARDALWWMTLRVVRAAISWTNEDIAYIFRDLWNNALAPDPIGATLNVTPTGVKESRSVSDREIRKVWNVMKEMLDTGLDVTTIVQDVYAGQMNWPNLKLTASDVTGDPSITKDGDLYGNRIYFDANRDTNAVWPPTPASRSAQGYPLVERALTDVQIADQQSATNAAKARWEASTYVPRVVNTNDSITLSPSSSYDVPSLLPGALTEFDAVGLCYSEPQTYRLGGVQANVEQGVEKINLELVPVGTLDPFTEADSVVGADDDVA